MERRIAIAMALALACCSCARHMYPYALVRTNNKLVLPTEVPSVEPEPVISKADYLVLRSISTRTIYFIVPLNVELVQAQPTDRLQGVALQSSTAKRLVFIAHFAPTLTMLQSARQDLAALGVPITDVLFYPTETLNLSLITDPRDAGVISATLVPATSASSAAYSALLILQSLGEDNVAKAKQLLAGSLGFVFQGLISYRTGQDGASRSISVKYFIRQVSVSSQTI